VGLGRPDETDFTSSLRLLVVGQDARQAAALAQRAREAIGPHAHVLVGETLADVDGIVRAQAVDCVVLGLTGAEPGSLPALEAVLASVRDVPVVYLIEPNADPEAISQAIHSAIARKRTDVGRLRQAFNDSLTGLPNRSLLLDRLNVAIGRSRRRPTSVAVLFLDLDGFKRINDGFGHEAGDRVLVEIAGRMQRVLRPGDTVARYGGDEFVILCEDLRGQREAVRVAKRTRAAIAEPLSVHGQEVTIEASVGIARARRGQASAEDLIREADIAMYRAKRAGGGVEVFDPGTGADAITGLEIEQRLRDAVAQAGLVLHYQPVMMLAGGRLHSLEALSRWEHPERGLIAPAEFLPLAEETGLAADVDRWVLGEACRQLAVWRAGGLLGDDRPVSVNLSAASLRLPGLAETIASSLAAAGVPPGCLWLEVTEASLGRDFGRAAATLEDLAGAGVGLCLDGFGLDASNLAALATHPFAAVKINAATPARMLAASLAAARALGLEALAKGVKTPAELEHVSGCDAAQGFAIAPPAPAEQTASFLAWSAQ
jgi:diguanylate cyclase (GGDEF)-like protein